MADQYKLSRRKKIHVYNILFQLTFTETFHTLAKTGWKKTGWNLHGNKEE